MDVCERACVEQIFEDVKAVCAALRLQCHGALFSYSGQVMLVLCYAGFFVLGVEVSHAV